MYTFLIGKNRKLSYYLVPEAMSPLHVWSEVCLALFHVRSKVCIAPIHVRSLRKILYFFIAGEMWRVNSFHEPYPVTFHRTMMFFLPLLVLSCSVSVLQHSLPFVVTRATTATVAT